MKWEPVLTDEEIKKCLDVKVFEGESCDTFIVEPIRLFWKGEVKQIFKEAFGFCLFFEENSSA